MDSNEDEGVCYAQPVTLDDRVRIANDFVKRCDYEIPLAIDPVDNPANELYAGWPERFYIVDVDGTIAYKGETGPFGYHPEEVAAWLMKRFPPTVLPPNDVSSDRILKDSITVRAVEYFDSEEAWRLTIDSSNQATLGRAPDAKSLRLDPDRALALRRTLADEDFFAWKEASGQPDVEGTTRTLVIGIGGDAKIVHRYSPLEDDELPEGSGAPEIERFEKVWSLLRSFDSR